MVSPAQPVSGRRIMVVDDNKDTADTLSMLIRIFGHEVETFYNGPSALANIQRYQPEIAVLDIVMPGMDGFQLIRAIRQLPEFSSIYAISISGFGRNNDHDRAMNAGFDVHLAKPVDIELLEKLLKEH